MKTFGKKSKYLSLKQFSDCLLKVGNNSPIKIETVEIILIYLETTKMADNLFPYKNNW